MGELIHLYRDGTKRDALGRTPNARMLERLGSCHFSQPERSSWVFVFETTVPVSWFRDHVRFVLVSKDGSFLTASIRWIESKNGTVNIQCHWPVPFSQLGDTSQIPHTPGIYLVTRTDEWHPIVRFA